MTTDAKNKPTRPDYERAEYRAGQYARDLCHDLMAGTSAIRAGGEKYLPRWAAEKKKNWKIRAAISQVARYYQRTVQASVGMILATPPKLGKETDPIIVADAEDIDGRGTHLEVLARTTAEKLINGGYTALLIECPPVPAGYEPTLAEEQALGLRPYWVPVTADRIISWIDESPDWATLLKRYLAGEITAEQVGSSAKQRLLRQVVIYEPTALAAGDFGSTCVDRYRVLRLTDQGVTFKVWEKRKSDDITAEDGVKFEVVAEGAMMAARKPLLEIPLALFGELGDEPPLLGLAELNLEHYQVSADRRYLMKLCHAPTLVVSGWEAGHNQDGTQKDETIEVGPNSTIVLPKGGTAAYVAAPANALDSSKEEKEELVRQMATLGMSFIGKDKRGASETATGRSLDNAAENATHATTARKLQDGFEKALRFHAMYRDVPAPEITINTSYASPEVDPAIVTALWNAVAADKLDVESWVTYVRTGQLPDDVVERMAMLRFAVANSASDAAAKAADPAAAKTPGAMNIEYDAATNRPTRLVPTAA